MDKYDIVIIGGGISGLNCADKLIKKNKIALFERSNILGGRVKSVKKNNLIYEAGAGRICENNKLLLKLIKKFNLQKHLLKISSLFDSFPKNNNTLKFQNYYDLLQDLIEKSKKKSKKYLINKTLEEFCIDVYNRKYSQFLIDSHPYLTEFKLMNCYAAINSFENDLNDKNQYYVLLCGLDKIIKCLEKSFVLKGGRVFKNHNLIEINKDGDYILTFFNNNKFKKIKAKKVICAFDKNSIENIDYLKKIKDLDSVLPSPLLRIYQQFPHKNGKSWFSGINKVVTKFSYNKLKYFIPIDASKGLVMTSYTDGPNAEYWNKLIEKGVHEEKLQKELENLFKKHYNVKKIPKPIFTDVFYWNNGACFWKKGYDPDKVYRKMIKPLNEELYICGDCYSMRQAWQEGALETSELVINKINKTNKTYKSKPIMVGGKKTKKKTINKSKPLGFTMADVKKHKTEDDAWTVIGGVIYDITKWIKLHPGGKSSILKIVGKDGTKLFNNSHGHVKSDGKTVRNDVLNMLTKSPIIKKIGKLN